MTKPLQPFRQSYAKALLAHPPARLMHELENQPEPTEAVIVGALTDALTFQTPLDKFAFSEFEEFRTKEAREWRDTQIAAGKHIVRTRIHNEAKAIAAAARVALFSETGWLPSGDDLGVRTQVPLAWEHQGNAQRLCVGTADAINERFCVDLKITDIPICDDAVVTSHIVRMYWHIQAYAYTAALEQMRGEQYQHVIVLVEREAPHCYRSVLVGESLIELGRRQFDRAASIWFDAARTRRAAPMTAEAPTWAITREEAL